MLELSQIHFNKTSLISMNNSAWCIWLLLSPCSSLALYNCALWGSVCPAPRPLLLPPICCSWLLETWDDAALDQYTHTYFRSRVERQSSGSQVWDSCSGLKFYILYILYKFFASLLPLSRCVSSTLHQKAFWPHAGSRFISVQHRHSCLQCFLCVLAWQCVCAEGLLLHCS